MNKKYLIAIIPVVIILLIVLLLMLFDNTTKNIVDKNKTIVTFKLCSKSIKNNKVDLELCIDNQNDFDIGLLTDSYSDNDMNFTINPADGPILIKKNSRYSNTISVEFNNKIDKQNYINIIQSKEIQLSFFAYDANQNDVITLVEVDLKNMGTDL